MIRFSEMVCDVVRMAGFAAFALTVHAQTHYPTKPIRIVVPYFPGSPSDSCARMPGQKFSESLGKPVVIENVAGASGNIGTERVALANPDGYSLVLPGNAPLSINPSLDPNLPFDPLKDFAPISQIAWSASMLIVQNSQTAKTLQELVALAKVQPGKLIYVRSSPSWAWTSSAARQNNSRRSCAPRFPSGRRS